MPLGNSTGCQSDYSSSNFDSECPLSYDITIIGGGASGPVECSDNCDVTKLVLNAHTEIHTLNQVAQYMVY